MLGYFLQLERQRRVIQAMLASLFLTVANFYTGGLPPQAGATIPSELAPERRGTAIGFNVFAAAMIGTF